MGHLGFLSFQKMFLVVNTKIPCEQKVKQMLLLKIWCKFFDGALAMFSGVFTVVVTQSCLGAMPGTTHFSNACWLGRLRKT